MPSNLTDIILPKLFDGRFFRIPDYQRGYAWGDSQLQDMWEDIQDILSNTNSAVYHFTGTITLKERSNSDLNPDEVFLKSITGCEFCDVVDGQQRLTTLVILMSELIAKIDPSNQKKLKEIFIVDQPTTGNPVYKLSYSVVNGNNNQHLLKTVYRCSTALPSQPNVYTNNIDNAKAFFNDRLSGLSPQDAMDLYVQMSQSLIFDVKYISNNLHVQAVFETMNNRGKPLTVLEKLKNRLMFLASRLPNPGNLPDKINQAWGVVYNKLGEKPSQPLKEDEFLSAHLSLLREPADYVYSESLAEERLFKMFCNRAPKYDDSDARKHASNPEPAVDYKKIDEYAASLSDFVKYWYEVNFPNTSSDLGLLILKIQFLDGSKEVRLFLSKMLSLYKSNQVIVNECLEKVHQILVRNTLPSVKIMDPRTLATRARELHKTQIKLSDLKDTLDDYLSIPLSPISIVNAFRNLFEYQRGKLGVYRWSDLKYFLMEYEDYRRKKATKKAFVHIPWEQFENTSIEHVLPQTFSPNWDMEMANYKSALASKIGRPLQNNEENIAQTIIINTLGNFTIIQDVRNPSVSNSSWNDKKTYYAHGCYTETYIVSTYAVWNEKNILDNGKEMLRFLCTDYLKGAITLTPQEIEQILFYDRMYLP